MNAPQRITSLVVGPGVLLLRPAQEVDATRRARAVDALQRKLKRSSGNHHTSRAALTAADLLANVRHRHAGAANDH